MKEKKNKENIEWPKEKLIQFGQKNLTKSELMAIILNSGSGETDVVEMSKKILRKFPRTTLARSSVSELEKLFGISSSKSCELIACVELGRRLALGKKREGKK